MQLWSTVLLPAIIGRVVILVKYLTKFIDAGDLERGYKLVGLGQIAINQIYFVMIFTNYKSFLVHVSLTLRPEGGSDIFILDTTLLMTLYSHAL